MKRKNGTLLPDDNDNALMVALLFIFFCVTCMVLSVALFVTIICFGLW